MRHYQKYPKNNFDLLFLQMQYYTEETNTEYEQINYQKFSQSYNIFKHKLKVMGIEPEFNDKEWFLDNFDDLSFIRVNLTVNSGTDKEICISDEEGIISTCAVSQEFYRAIKNYSSILFIIYEGFIFDFMPLPDIDDIKDYDRYNFEKNLTNEQMRYFRILFSQIEQDVETDWEQYDGTTENLLHNAYVYQNKRYDEASDNTIPLLSDDEVDDFFNKKEELLSECFMVVLYPEYKKKKMVLKSHLSDTISYKCPLTKEFYKILIDAEAIVFCVKDFEIVDMIPLYDMDEENDEE